MWRRLTTTTLESQALERRAPKLKSTKSPWPTFLPTSGVASTPAIADAHNVRTLAVSMPATAVARGAHTLGVSTQATANVQSAAFSVVSTPATVGARNVAILDDGTLARCFEGQPWG